MGGGAVFPPATCRGTRRRTSGLHVLSRGDPPIPACTWSAQTLRVDSGRGPACEYRPDLAVTSARASPQYVHAVSASSLSLLAVCWSSSSEIADRHDLANCPLRRTPHSVAPSKRWCSLRSMSVRRSALLRGGPFPSGVATPNRSSPLLEAPCTFSTAQSVWASQSSKTNLSRSVSCCPQAPHSASTCTT